MSGEGLDEEPTTSDTTPSPTSPPGPGWWQASKNVKAILIVAALVLVLAFGSIALVTLLGRTASQNSPAQLRHERESFVAACSTSASAQQCGCLFDTLARDQGPHWLDVVAADYSSNGALSAQDRQIIATAFTGCQ